MQDLTFFQTSLKFCCLLKLYISQSYVVCKMKTKELWLKGRKQPKTIITYFHLSCCWRIRRNLNLISIQYHSILHKTRCYKRYKINKSWHSIAGKNLDKLFICWNFWLNIVFFISKRIHQFSWIIKPPAKKNFCCNKYNKHSQLS